VNAQTIPAEKNVDALPYPHVCDSIAKKNTNTQSCTYAYLQQFISVYMTENPDYPTGHQRWLLRFLIDMDGKCPNVEILNNTDPKALSYALKMLQAMDSWAPALKENNAVPFWMMIPIEITSDTSNVEYSGSWSGRSGGKMPYAQARLSAKTPPIFRNIAGRIVEISDLEFSYFYKNKLKKRYSSAGVITADMTRVIQSAKNKGSIRWNAKIYTGSDWQNVEIQFDLIK